jgi:phage tail sheath gpL-like
MPISFNQIPANWRMPLYWVELDPSKAGLGTYAGRSLLVGIMNSAAGANKGTATPDVPIAVASQAQADALFGQGSMLAEMFKAFYANNWANEVWGLPVAEPTGAAAAGSILVATPPTAAGTIDLYISGHNVPVYVGASDTVDQIGTSIAAAITANPNLPVTAVATAGSVAVTAKFKGTSGNEIRLSDSYYGTVGGEMLPTGVSLTYTQPTGGTGDPVFTNAISNLGEAEIDYVCMPFTDSTSMLAWETEFGFSDTGRWGFVRQHYGQIFNAKRGIYSDLLTFGATRNSAQMSVLGIEVGSPTPSYAWAAAYCAKAARALLNDPARPLQTLQLESCLPAQSHFRFLLSELNALAYGGIATQRTMTTVPVIMRESTTYTKNLYGNTDDAYELVTTPATLTKLLRNQRQAITSKFPRHKLADDGTRFGAGQAIVTPKIIKAELVAEYRIDEFNGLVENGKAFKANLIVERDTNDPNRVNVLYPPDLVNQLRVFAVLAQFRLQYDRGLDTVIAA